ncbi:4-trimethylaminobutyraldehyde dehydrogenase-like [Diadema antillarum]|uniref:4-trimethylaminobutyraldehyde dehydrogenase-like n=1 Tax=Diadema antillarum TaxID=105358 RepID=UPI003A88988A
MLPYTTHRLLLTQSRFVKTSRCLSSTFWDQPLNFIGGERVRPTGDQRSQDFSVLEPSTGRLLCESPSSGKEDVDRAVAAAQDAFGVWSETPAIERARTMQRAAQKMRDNLEDFARLESTNNGKAIWEARFDIHSAIDAIDFYAGLAPSLTGHHISCPGGSYAYTRREPLGVCAGIGAWNYPIQMAGWKSAPALACGNTMVFKPSQFTPATALLLAEIYSDCGLPKGVFNVIQGQGETGHLLTSHPGVSKVSFTGSVPTGKLIMKTCADDVKHLTLELGGKSPLLIFSDADLDNAAKGAVMANFLSQGEVCSNATRVFVHRSIKDAFVERFLDRTKRMKLGNPLLEDTTVGAVISREHQEKIMGYIKGAIKEGATVLCGGERAVPEDPALAGGFYVAPTILDDVTDDMVIAQEEVFGPVATILTFDTEEEAIERANDTKLGLACGLFTRDLQRAHRVAARLQAGNCWINNYNNLAPGVPFGGYKQSGLGRENGLATVDYYTQMKTIYVELGDVECPV